MCGGRKEVTACWMKECGERWNDSLVNTLPFSAHTLECMLPSVKHFSYFLAGSGLACSIATNHCHAILHLFQKRHSKLYKSVKTNSNFLLVLGNNDVNAYVILPNRRE
jgi:hypothetical protein